MHNSIQDLAENFRIADAFDILLATVIFSSLIFWIRKRSAHAVVFTIVGLAGLYLLSDWLRMYLTLTIFRAGFSVLLFGLVVVFQQDLRYAFEKLASWRPFQSNAGLDTQKTTETLVEAVSIFADERIGALIVLPGRQDLDRHLRGGVNLDGRVSLPLLHSIFHAKSPGHDGAIVIRNRRVEKFGVHLPLSGDTAAIGPGGTRHAAALGLAERSDALVIVVSEERGTVSVARDGGLYSLESPTGLAEEIRRFEPHSKGTQEKTSRLSRYGSTVFASGTGLILAVGLWLLLANPVEPVQRIVNDVPLETVNAPPDWVIEDLHPQSVRIGITGSKRAFRAFSWEQLRAQLDLSDVHDGEQTVVLTEESFELPSEMSLASVEPNVIRLKAFETVEAVLPVKVATRGKLPEGKVIAKQEISPAELPVRVRKGRADRIGLIPTQLIDLSEINESTTRRVELNLPVGVWTEPGTSPSVTVTWTIEEKPPETPDGKEKEEAHAPACLP